VLPYLQLQLLLFLASAAAVAVLWRVSASVPRLVASLFWRLLACAAAFALLARVAMALKNSGFLGVALLFYGCGVCLPVLGLFEVVRTRSARKRSHWILAGACAAVLLVAFDALLIEPNRLQLAEHELSFEAWPAEAPALRVVQISDLQTVGPCEREERALALIESLHPDLIVFCGDYVAGPFDDPEPAVADARNFLSRLRAPLGIICVPGHSEPEAVRRLVFEGLDVRYLWNEEETLELGAGRRLRIVGLSANKPDCALLERPREPGLVTLVASHVPDLSWNLDGTSVDLHLAGHTHGGQITIPFWGPPVTKSQLPRGHARGLHRFGDHWLNVTPGIGMEGHYAPRIRFLNPPQVELLLLKGGGSAVARVEPPRRPERYQLH
jgi:uncharacterized protein